VWEKRDWRRGFTGAKARGAVTKARLHQASGRLRLSPFTSWPGRPETNKFKADTTTPHHRSTLGDQLAAAASSPGRTSNRSDGRHRALDLPCLLRQTGPSGGTKTQRGSSRAVCFVRMHVHGEMATGPGERPAGAVSLFGLAWLARDLFVPFPTGLEPNLVWPCAGFTKNSALAWRLLTSGD